MLITCTVFLLKFARWDLSKLQEETSEFSMIKGTYDDHCYSANNTNYIVFPMRLAWSHYSKSLAEHEEQGERGVAI